MAFLEQIKIMKFNYPIPGLDYPMPKISDIERFMKAIQFDFIFPALLIFLIIMRIIKCVYQYNKLVILQNTALKTLELEIKEENDD